MFGILRTLLALNVVLLHIFNVHTIGNYSVSFFFLLSGFLMTLIMQETYGYSLKGFKIFWVNRFLRLYPIYWLFAIFTIILIIIFPEITGRDPLIKIPNSSIEWMANITMIFPKIVPHRFNPILLPAAWALTNELLFYFLISLGISKTAKRTIIWLLLSLGYYIGTYLFYDLDTYRYSAIFASSLPFALGALLYWLIKIKPLRKVRIEYIVLLYIGFLANAYFKYKFRIELREISIYFNMIVAFFMVYMLFHLKLSKRWRKWDYYIGMYSYPIYLSHYLVAILYIALIGYGVYNTKLKMDFVALPIYVALLFFICFLVVLFIDKRINNIKNRIKKAL